jgi:hypothetical protein
MYSAAMYSAAAAGHTQFHRHAPWQWHCHLTLLKLCEVVVLGVGNVWELEVGQGEVVHVRAYVAGRPGVPEVVCSGDLTGRDVRAVMQSRVDAGDGVFQPWTCLEVCSDGLAIAFARWQKACWQNG